MGKEQPFATNSTVEGRELNRRVEFFISDIPGATEKAVQLIPFNPCFRNDQDVEGSRPGSGCDNTSKRIPVFSPDSDTPTRLINLTPRPPERARLPDIRFERPPLRDLIPIQASERSVMPIDTLGDDIQRVLRNAKAFLSSKTEEP